MTPPRPADAGVTADEMQDYCGLFLIDRAFAGSLGFPFGITLGSFEGFPPAVAPEPGATPASGAPPPPLGAATLTVPTSDGPPHPGRPPRAATIDTAITPLVARRLERLKNENMMDISLAVRRLRGL